MKTKGQNAEIERLFKTFKAQSTLTNLQPLRNMGLGLKRLENNQWNEVKEYNLDKGIGMLVLLYNDDLVVEGVGIY